jgi:hypothetical protein
LHFHFSGNPGQKSNLGDYCDPFTGSGAYRSGSGGVPTAKDYASGNVEPASGLISLLGIKFSYDLVAHKFIF